jgi:pimeloyl-ACP methyl ester carboxylesterase
MNVTTSSDGTRIAYDRTGVGPALVVVNGALGDRTATAALAEALAPKLTVFSYDRRGRGDSGDTQPYAVEREIEDLEAMIATAGGEAFVFGHSSGAALALEAAVRGLAITKLALYEPPYIVDDSRTPLPDDYIPTLQALVDDGRPGDALEYFWRVALQMPPDVIAQMRGAPWWPGMEALGHTLPYDNLIVDGHMDGKPLPDEWANQVTIPTLVIDGGASPDSMRNAVAAVAALLPRAERLTLEGQGHGAPTEVLAPVLEAFFL